VYLHATPAFEGWEGSSSGLFCLLDNLYMAMLLARADNVPHELCKRRTIRCANTPDHANLMQYQRLIASDQATHKKYLLNCLPCRYRWPETEPFSGGLDDMEHGFISSSLIKRPRAQRETHCASVQGVASVDGSSI
jgi:hypothetical protein